MTIGEFSKKTGISVYTLRYYEDKKLIVVPRDEKGRRVYTQKEIEWVQFIKRLKETGMKLRSTILCNSYPHESNVLEKAVTEIHMQAKHPYI